MLNFRLDDELSALKKDLGDIAVDFSTQCQSIAQKIVTVPKPNDAEIYQAALLYLKGEITPDIDYLYSLVAFGLYLPIESLGNRTVAGDAEKLEALLDRYRAAARDKRLWEMTWWGVLQSYFDSAIRGRAQDSMLRFLQDTAEEMPFWAKTLADYPALLMREPARIFAEDWLLGKEEAARAFAAEAQIPAHSWFWQNLTQAAVRYATGMTDDGFKAQIPRLLELIEGSDEDLDSILSRYAQCADTSLHAGLKAYALKHWKNPKLRYAGVSKWRVAQLPAWQLVLSWVNEENLRIFFERVGREERLDLWFDYIEWTKRTTDLHLHARDMTLVRLIEAEEEVLASEESGKLEIFMMQVKNYLAAS